MCQYWGDLKQAKQKWKPLLYRGFMIPSPQLHFAHCNQSPDYSINRIGSPSHSACLKKSCETLYFLYFNHVIHCNLQCAIGTSSMNYCSEYHLVVPKCK